MIRRISYLVMLIILVWSTVGFGEATRAPISTVRWFSIVNSAKKITVSVVVNDDHFTISDNDITQTISFASKSFLASGLGSYTILDIHHDHYGNVEPQNIFDGYLDSHTNNLPDYVIVFSKDEVSMGNGAYKLAPYGINSKQHSLIAKNNPNFCNDIGSPYFASGVIYGAVFEWGHLIGQCGYERQGYNLVHVSDTSFGGQCINQNGLKCVYAYGAWQCPNLIDDPINGPEIKDLRLFTAQSINHELLHCFGIKGNDDHWCSDDVPAEVAAQSVFNMCGTNVVALKKSKHACFNAQYLGASCTSKAECGTYYCYEFNLDTQDLFQCAMLCTTNKDCPPVVGKSVTCKSRSTAQHPDVDNACYYEDLVHLGKSCSTKSDCGYPYGCIKFNINNQDFTQCASLCTTDDDCGFASGKSVKCQLRTSKYPEAGNACYYKDMAQP